MIVFLGECQGIVREWTSPIPNFSDYYVKVYTFIGEYKVPRSIILNEGIGI